MNTAMSTSPNTRQLSLLPDSDSLEVRAAEELRKELKLNQEEFADALGLPAATYRSMVYRKGSAVSKPALALLRIVVSYPNVMRDLVAQRQAGAV